MLEYDNLENIKADRVNRVVFNLHQIKQSKFFFGTPNSVKILHKYDETPLTVICIAVKADFLSQLKSLAYNFFNRNLAPKPWLRLSLD